MSGASPVRLDALLVDRGLAASRERAKALIESGVVLIDGIPARRASTQVKPDRDIRLASGDFPWVSRGALKLLGAIEEFQVDPTGLACADFGSSTGGFTEVLVERGASRVYAIDVGRGQLAWKLRQHERVVVMEGVNARHLEGLPEPISLVVGDLSFISITLILPAVRRVLAPDGRAVVLVKPQFEAGREAIGKGGKVRSDDAREAAIDAVRAAAIDQGFALLGSADSALPGARAGNVEHFLYLQRNG
jgi:23S rRNA (cytidine1920-2'-O)/16S rRNA (cytidine1409-2'-O)-methyltransferase